MSGRLRVFLIAGAVSLMVAIVFYARLTAPIPFPMIKAIAGCAALDPAVRLECYGLEIPALHPAVPISDIFAGITAAQAYDPVLIDCHSIAHRLGEAVVADDPDAWAGKMLAEGAADACAFGYIHGLTIAVYGDRTYAPEDTESGIKRLEGLCDLPGYGELMRRSCHHGLGHMLYYLSNADIDVALRACDRVATRAEDGLFRRVCYTGVTMKLFTSLEGDEYEDPHGLTEENAPTFCASLAEERFVHACNRARWVLSAERLSDGTDIEAFCATTDPRETRYCLTKVLHGFAWKYVREPDRMIALCDRVGPLKAQCLISAAVERVVSGGGKVAVQDAMRYCENDASGTCMWELAEYGSYLYADSAQRAEYCSAFDSALETQCVSLAYR